MDDAPSISLLEQARYVAERLQRNKKEMIALISVMEVKAGRLKQRIKDRDDAIDDVTRLSKELETMHERKVKLTTWLVNHCDTEQDVAKVSALAEKIKKLRAQMERIQKELQEAQQ